VFILIVCMLKSICNRIMCASHLIIQYYLLTYLLFHAADPATDSARFGVSLMDKSRTHVTWSSSIRWS